MMQALLNHPLTQALGWSLLHFLWQGALLGAVLLTLNALTRRSSPQLRYALACLVMLAMPVVFIATFLGGAPVPAQPSSTPLAGLAPAAVPLVLPGAHPALAPSFANFPGWAVCLWLLGVIALSAHTAGAWMRVQRLKRRTSAVMDPVWIDLLESLQRRLKIGRPVRLCLSAVAEVPAIVGWLRPVVLLPVTAITGLDQAQLRAILAHELAHIRRHDYLVNLLQTAVETLLFYHPAVWWVGRHIRREREHCCDDLAIAACGDVMVYAGALARLEELRGSIPEPALAASGGDLLARIRRLTNPDRAPQRLSKSLGGIIAAAVVLCLAAAPLLRSVNAAPQNPPAPAAAPAVPAPPAPAIGKGQGIGEDIGQRRGEGIRLGEAQAALNRTLAQLNQSMAQLNSGSPRAPRAGTGQGVDLLLKLYDSTQVLPAKRKILSYLGESDNPKASEKVLSLARADPNLELRRAAISYLAQHDKSFDTLVSLYDRDNDVQIKQAILSYLAESDDARASDKIFSIAQSDPSPELRRAAISYLAER